MSLSSKLCVSSVLIFRRLKFLFTYLRALRKSFSSLGGKHSVTFSIPNIDMHFSINLCPLPLISQFVFLLELDMALEQKSVPQSDNIKYEDEDSEAKNEKANTFIEGMSSKNIEEDPFSDDFKDEKFNVQI